MFISSDGHLRKTIMAYVEILVLSISYTTCCAIDVILPRIFLLNTVRFFMKSFLVESVFSLITYRRKRREVGIIWRILPSHSGLWSAQWAF